jgi:Glycosyltransferase family 87
MAGGWTRGLERTRALRDGAIVAGLLFAAYLFAVIGPSARTFGFDAFAYWANPITDPYQLTTGSFGAFLYSPVAARLFAPAALVAWPTFLWLWSGVLLATAIWLGGRKRWLWVLAFPPVALELYHGNIHLLIAAAIALGFRYPAAWSFVLLTKVTPGIGLLWFAVRREWRNLAIVGGLTGALVVASVVIDPQLWRQWIERQLVHSLQTGPDQAHIPIPLWIRLPAAAALVTWGALRDRTWTVPVAAAIAMPVLWVTAFATLAALAAMNRPELQPRSAMRNEPTITAANIAQAAS